MGKLLYTRKTTDLHLNLCLGVPPIFKSFVLIFELKEPSVHRLFDELEHVVRTFFICFIKIENVKSLSSKKLAKLDVKDLNYQLPICDWFVGSKIKELLKTLRFSDFFLSFSFFSLLWQDCLILFQTFEFLISYCHWKYCQSVCAEMRLISQLMYDLIICVRFRLN